MKKIYKDLLKIKNPVFILAVDEDPGLIRERCRILYPNGRCVYTCYGEEGIYSSSCFAEKRDSLYETIVGMEEFDLHSSSEIKTKILGFYEI